MTRIYIMVEGQTEESFVRELLVPHYAPAQKYMTPIIVSTSPGHKGGVVSYGKVRPQLLRKCKEDGDAYVTTMFDLYALPGDFPGQGSPLFPGAGRGVQKAQFLEQELARDVNLANFIPNLVVHEYEALLFADTSKFAEWTQPAVVTKLATIAGTHQTPEDINNSPLTAPSKRLRGVMSAYQKTFHGPLVACDIGLPAIRAACPHFDAWLGKLESLP